MERRHVKTLDIPGAYLKAKLPSHNTPIYVCLNQIEAAILCPLHPEYSQYLLSDGTMPARVTHALYGLIQSAQLWLADWYLAASNEGLLGGRLVHERANRAHVLSFQCRAYASFPAGTKSRTARREDELDELSRDSGHRYERFGGGQLLALTATGRLNSEHTRHITIRYFSLKGRVYNEMSGIYRETVFRKSLAL
jgi:hypothetical protein